MPQDKATLLNARKCLALCDTLHDFLKTRQTGVSRTIFNQFRVYAHQTFRRTTESLNTFFETYPDMYKYFYNRPQNINEKNVLHKYISTFINNETHTIIKSEINDMIIEDSEEFVEACKDLYRYPNIVFVADSNKLGRDVLCNNDSNFFKYEGFFNDLDFKPSDDTNTPESCKVTEFQDYKITKRDGSLLSYEEISIDHEESEIRLLQYDGTLNTIDIPAPNERVTRKRIGVGEIKNLLAKTFRRTREDFEKDFDEEVYKMIKDMFGLEYTSFEHKDEYIRCLYDIKRAGDYISVQATAVANKNRTRAEKKEKLYVFVSNDILSIARALLLGVPAVHTTSKGSKKNNTYRLDITLYNISNITMHALKVPQSARALQDAETYINVDSALASASVSDVIPSTASRASANTASRPRTAPISVEISSPEAIGIIKQIGQNGAYIDDVLNTKKINNQDVVLRLLTSANKHKTELQYKRDNKIKLTGEEKVYSKEITNALKKLNNSVRRSAIRSTASARGGTGSLIAANPSTPKTKQRIPSIHPAQIAPQRKQKGPSRLSMATFENDSSLRPRNLFPDNPNNNLHNIFDAPPPPSNTNHFKTAVPKDYLNELFFITDILAFLDTADELYDLLNTMHETYGVEKITFYNYIVYRFICYIDTIRR